MTRFMWTLIRCLPFVLLGSLCSAQSGLVAYYPFEDCTAKDVSLNNSDGFVFGEPSCQCGVEGNAIYLDGIDDHITLAGNVETYFSARAFTISFYFRIDDADGTFEVLSKRNNCDFNNAFGIRYTPASRRLSVDIAESPTEASMFFQQIDPGICWVHLAVAVGETEQRIYVNGRFLAATQSDAFRDISNNAPISIGNGACSMTTDKRFKGLIDEIRVYNRALDGIEVADLYLGPDRIATRDTTIYGGSSARLVAGPTCADNYAWSPAGTIDNPTASSVLATPASTQTYTMSLDYGTCIATDTVRVEVINPEDIECGNVPLPNAFTPNNDGRNDAFFISNPFALEVLDAFEIFDRWGNRVFAAENVRDSWDGTYNGVEVNPGLYLYKIKYKCQGEDLTKSGSIMLIR